MAELLTTHRCELLKLMGTLQLFIIIKLYRVRKPIAPELELLAVLPECLYMHGTDEAAIIRKYGSTFYIGIAMVVLPYFGPWEN